MNESWGKKQIFSGSSLKWIAIITMVIDHIGAAILYYSVREEFGIMMYHITRNIGRASFPIFCFLLVEGFVHTHDVKRYAVQLGVFALISEFPFDLAFTREGNSIWMHQNVFWTLLIALFVLIGLRLLATKIPATYIVWQGPCYALCIAAGCGLAYLMRTDYDYKGIIAISVLYLFRSNRIWQVIAGGLCFFWEPWAILGFVPILLYNGKRGYNKMKYFFYWFYPVHLLLLYCIAHFVMHLH